MANFAITTPERLEPPAPERGNRVEAVMGGMEKRQFGRRESNIRGHVLVAGYQPIACTIRNISDGGALLECASQMPASRSIRLVVEGTDFNLRSEICHQGPRGFGIRFVSTAEGAAFNKHVQTTIVAPAAANAAVPPPALAAARVETPQQAISNRVLRQNMLQSAFDKIGAKMTLSEAHAQARDRVMMRMKGAAFGARVALAVHNDAVFDRMTDGSPS